MHGSEELPVIVGEFSGDVFGAHLLEDVRCSLFWSSLLLQGLLVAEEQRKHHQKFPMEYYCESIGFLAELPAESPEIPRNSI